MSKEYKYPKTKELVKKLQPYWEEMKEIQEEFYHKLDQLELKMWSDIKIEGIEFFFCDNEIVGIGNVSRTMELINGYEELENETSKYRKQS